MEDVIISSANSWGVTAYGPFGERHRWYRERNVAKVLEALNDATLKGIGTSRCEIPWIG
jgi:uncharacterized protein YjiS (DUF1127 family)